MGETMNIAQHIVEHAVLGVGASSNGTGVNPNTPVLVIGGDHPYSQWMGDGSNNGMAKMYRDRGIDPYIAVCWDASEEKTSGNGATFKDIGGFAKSITTQEALILQAQGVEFVSHGTRHVNHWRLINTGIRIEYVSNIAAAPTVHITATDVVLTGNGGAENSTISLAANATLSALKTSIDAVSGWKCHIAEELIGTEPTSLLNKLKAARNVKIDVSDKTDSKQRFALAGGIHFTYTGNAYNDIRVNVTSSKSVTIWIDGVRFASIAPATNSLNDLIAAINALSITGLSVQLLDNSYSIQSPKFRETYCWGDELQTNLNRVDYETVNVTGLACSTGIGRSYAIRRLLLSCREKAKVYGINLNNFAQSGGQFDHWLQQGSMDVYENFRLENEFIGSYPPKAVAANSIVNVTTQVTISKDYGSTMSVAMLNALVESGPMFVDVLMHHILPDGSSGYVLPYMGADYDQTESDWIIFLDKVKELRDKGLIDVVTPSVAARIRPLKAKPHNMLFNATFKNYGGSLSGIISDATGSTGKKIPGWLVSTAVSNYSSVVVANNAMTITTNGALSGGQAPIKQWVPLDVGVTYDMGAQLDLSGIPDTASVRVNIRPTPDSSVRFGEDTKYNNNILQSQQFYGGQVIDARFRFTPQSDKSYAPARIVSLAEPFNLTAGAQIKLNYDSIGSTADIVIAGAVPSATTAKEIVTAINSGIAATAAYNGRGEYQNIARVENGRIIIEGKVNNSAQTSQYLSIVNGTVGTPLTAVFGGADVRAFSRPHRNLNTAVVGHIFEIELLSGLNGTVKITSPFCIPTNYR
jgi:hypothetical protein